MIEDYEQDLASPRVRPNWLHRMLEPFRTRRPTEVPTSAHLRRDLGLGDEPIGRRLG